MWLHVIDYTNQRLLAIKVGEVPEDAIDTEFSSSAEEFYYAKISEHLGHTTFDWVSSESKNIEVIGLREEKLVTKTSNLEVAVGTTSDDCYVEKFTVPITTGTIRTLKEHQEFLLKNKDISMLRVSYPIDLDEPEFRVGGSHIDIFDKSIYISAYHKHNSDCYFESVELTIEELEKQLTDA